MTSLISKNTAMDIALAYREVESAEKLLADIEEALNRQQTPDIRDAFGRHQGGLQLGVPHGQNGQRLFNVPWALSRPILEAHIAQQKAIIVTLSRKAMSEAITSGAENNHYLGLSYQDASRKAEGLIATAAETGRWHHIVDDLVALRSVMALKEQATLPGSEANQ